MKKRVRKNELLDRAKNKPKGERDTTIFGRFSDEKLNWRGEPRKLKN